MKILVTGITGQLGHDVMKVLAARGHEAIGASRKEFSDRKSTRLNSSHP